MSFDILGSSTQYAILSFDTGSELVKMGRCKFELIGYSVDNQ